MPAPARWIAVSVSKTMARWSIQPAAAAALTMLNSPETLKAAKGTPGKWSAARRMMSR